MRDEVPNCRLRTLADRFRLPHRPTHRALDDALATADLLHALLERAAAYGVTGLDDLLALPKIGGHPQVAKLKLTNRLPRQPGVYLFRDRGGQAALRRQGHRPPQPGALLLLHRRPPEDRADAPRGARHRPPPVRARRSRRPCSRPGCCTPSGRRYNRQGTRWEHAAYVRLDVDERGPASSWLAATGAAASCSGRCRRPRAARLVVEAIETPRRCGAAPRGSAPGCFPLRDAAVRAGPARRGPLPVRRHRRRGGLPRRRRPGGARASPSIPTLLLDPLAERMASLAAAERYEEAADVRDRAAALVRGAAPPAPLRRAARRRRVELALPGGSAPRLERGVLRSCVAAGELPGRRRSRSAGAGAPSRLSRRPPARRLPAEAADELVAVASFLDRHAGRVRVLSISRASGPRPGPASPPSAPPPAERTSRRVASAACCMRSSSSMPSRTGSPASPRSWPGWLASPRSTPSPAPQISSRSIRVKEHDELADVVTRHIVCLEGITATETMVAFQAFSKHDLESMWSIGT